MALIKTVIVLCMVISASSPQAQQPARIIRQSEPCPQDPSLQSGTGSKDESFQDKLNANINECAATSPGGQSCAGGLTCVDQAEETMQQSSPGSIGLGDFGINSLSPSEEKFETYPTVMRCNYGDNDPLGYLHWDGIPGAQDTSNDCLTYMSPINFASETVGLSDPDIDQDILEEKKPSLVFRIAQDIDSVGWDFGFAPDIYNGIQVNTKRHGIFQVLDEYNSHQSADGYGGRMFDFGFATITFCDYNQVNPARSSHQIEGVKFPFEIFMIFFWAPPDIGISSNWAEEAENQKENIVGVSILGQVTEHDNVALKPMFDTAEKFSGPSYEEDWSQIPILEKFSPRNFLPDDSDYYYYKGSFPVPPCFEIARLYVLGKPLNISQKQLDILTHMKSAREPSGVLTCTMGKLLQRTTEAANSMVDNNILYNAYPIRIETTGEKPSEDELEHSSGHTYNINALQTILPYVLMLYA